MFAAQGLLACSFGVVLARVVDLELQTGNRGKKKRALVAESPAVADTFLQRRKVEEQDAILKRRRVAEQNERERAAAKAIAAATPPPQT